MENYDHPTVGQIQEFNSKLLRAASALIKGASPNELHALITGNLIDQQLRKIPFYRVWRTVEANNTTPKVMLKSLEDDGYFIRDKARNIIQMPLFIRSQEAKRTPLARVKIKDLRGASGSLQEQFRKGHSHSPITFAIEAVGGSFPSPDIALLLRDPEIYNKALLWVPNNTFPSEEGYRWWFCLYRDHEGRRWIDAIDTSPTFFWNERGEEEVVFIPREIS